MSKKSTAPRPSAKATTLPARPDLQQLRVQSKELLARLRSGDNSAASEFISHLPEARALSVARVLKAGYRLADAQSVVARRSGFASWPALARHVATLRALEGVWGFDQLEVDGNAVPASMLGASRILIDGDRFRTESPEAIYDGEFIIDVEADPCTIDIRFVEGPEAGLESLGIFTLDGDQWTICLGLVGATRPTSFTTKAGRRHALETLSRVAAGRPAGVSGGTARTPKAKAAASRPMAPTTAWVASPSALDAALAGEWTPLELVRDGKALPAGWLAGGRRVASGDEVQVIFGGQTMVHARVRYDDGSSPAHVDYLYLAGEAAGAVAHGICELRGKELRVNMAPPGAPRPADWESTPGSGRSFSRWRRS